MKKKLSFLLLALVTVAAFAYKVTNRAVAELAVVSEATTWDFSTDVTSSLSTDLKYEGDDAKAEKIYANIAELTFAETFKADALEPVSVNFTTILPATLVLKCSVPAWANFFLLLLKGN